MYKFESILVFVTLLICSCGRQFQNTSDTNSRPSLERRSSIAVMSPFILRQTVNCEDEQDCPESVAKIIIIDREKIRYCTGTLVDSDLMMTSSSCLTPSLRTPGLNCSKNIFVVFPKVGIRSIFHAGCSRVISSYGNLENYETSLWRGDFAFFRLDRKIPRKYSLINRSGTDEFSDYVSWKVDYENDTDGTLRKETCYPVFNSYANPFAKNSRSPMIPMVDCSQVEGNIGAPIMNLKGELVGVSSLSLDERISQFVLSSDLMSEPMANIHHMANLACATTPLDNKSMILQSSCRRPLSTSILDQMRSEMIFSTEIHKKEFKRIQEELETPVKYFKWKVSFERGQRGREYEAHIMSAQCFFDINKWIGEFTRFGGRVRSYATIDVQIPKIKLITKFSRVLKPVSVLESSKGKTYKIEFNPKNALKLNTTFVNIAGNVFDQETYQEFETISGCDL